MTYYHSQIARNAISEVLDFKISKGENAPGPPYVGRAFGATWRDVYFFLATPLVTSHLLLYLRPCLSNINIGLTKISLIIFQQDFQIKLYHMSIEH